jgi:hypothetical protein
VSPVGSRLAVGVARENSFTGVIYQFYIDSNATTGQILSLTNAAAAWGDSYQYELTITYQAAT